jgi:hypothetical protein
MGSIGNAISSLFSLHALKADVFAVSIETYRFLMLFKNGIGFK